MTRAGSKATASSFSSTTKNDGSKKSSTSNKRTYQVDSSVATRANDSENQVPQEKSPSFYLIPQSLQSDEQQQKQQSSSSITIRHARSKIRKKLPFDTIDEENDEMTSHQPSHKEKFQYSPTSQLIFDSTKSPPGQKPRIILKIRLNPLKDNQEQTSPTKELANEITEALGTVKLANDIKSSENNKVVSSRIIPFTRNKRIQSAANVPLRKIHGTPLRGQFLHAPDIKINDDVDNNNEINSNQTSQQPLPALCVKKTLSTKQIENFIDGVINDDNDVSPLRRSKRCVKLTKYKTAMNFDSFIDQECEDGLEIRTTNDKGRGIFSTKKFYRGDYIVEYAGDLISYQQAKQRELTYGLNCRIGCYMYYFKHGEKVYCVDATEETNRLGRLINHSRKGCNCQAKVFVIKDQPRLILIASRDINVGEELLYDYGERRKDVVDSFPWLNG
ncbi:unnamed protein product [Didymodactylos carnosus]|uniref:SET domain-containing protein n=1 Tax=Didymodactylos carnosus TaxID=1234261 RepID=A0A814BZ70_9BILA|nr:unnamed protein product [Didymodactylos carnosus]CAF0935509.1 unnamed protein product [Didymodactylos carnosus]CAF3535778.1 unnamed protein product [Didymodactylos carnosus]CAF3712802.1 unnamed protein product [Didymodactylos carnosus]